MSKHILSIDDEEVIRELVTEFLVAYGYRVTGAATAREALRVIETDPPDLIVTDLQLEETDGLELVERIGHILPNVPVILLTGMLFDTRVVDERLSRKVSSYLPKTTPLGELAKEVRRLLGDLPPAGT